jgi:hypothetical protein
LTVGPLEFKIMHAGPACWEVGGIIGCVWRTEIALEVGGRSKGSERLKRVEGHYDLFGDVENGGNTTVKEGVPVAGVVF